MKLVHITTCTNRKRVTASISLLGRTLPCGEMNDVAGEWMSRVAKASSEHVAHSLYCGRGFSASLSASQLAGTDLWVISAGLGLILSSEKVPSYSLTIASGTEDCIKDKIISDFDPSRWWSAVNTISGRSLSKLINDDSGESLFLISLSQPYAPLVIKDLMNCTPDSFKRIRIVGLMPSVILPEHIRTVCMPYDNRINDPTCLPGTMTDFAQRTAYHFVKYIWTVSGYQSATDDSTAVLKILNYLKAPIVPRRIHLSDVEIRNVIIANWNRAEGLSSRMLRVLRDDLNVACEQKRFSTIFKQIKEEMN